MSIESIHSYPILINEMIHNMKWTILSHLKYIVLSNDFNDKWEPHLTDRNFVDSTPSFLTTTPLFGVEFQGNQEITEGLAALFEIVYRGITGPIELEHGWGVMSPSRRLSFIHDSICLNFYELDRLQNIRIYNFTEPSNIPSDTGKLMMMKFVESSFVTDDQTGSRMDGINWVYEVRER